MSGARRTPAAAFVCVAVALAAAMLAAASCGSGGGRPEAVARVGSEPVSRAELTAKMAALAPEHFVPDAPRFDACVKRERAQAIVAGSSDVVRRECRQRYEALSHEALDSILLARWLVGEAAERHLPQPPAGTLEARAAHAASELRELARAGEPPIGRAQALSYYRRHTRRFTRQELRYVDLAENYASAAAAAAAKRAIEARGGAAARLPLHEVVERFNTRGRGDTTEAAKTAIFSAAPGVLSGPVRITQFYAIFEVTRTVPPARRPFAAVRRQIERQLAESQRRARLARFVSAWRAKWIARTSCAPGYVTSRCRQYTGARSEDDQTFS